jgi:hypothetical protein
MSPTLSKVRPRKLNQKMYTDFIFVQHMRTEEEMHGSVKTPADPELCLPLVNQGIGNDLRLKIWL